MKTKALLLLSLLLLAACASNPNKMPGRYGVMVVDDVTAHPRGIAVIPIDQVVSSLRERLAMVDLVDSTSDPSYDAVVVLRPGAPMPSYLGSSQTRENWVPRAQVVAFNIVRDGKNVASGTARIERGNEFQEESRTMHPIAVGTRQNYAAGIEIARQVVKALRAAG